MIQEVEKTDGVQYDYDSLIKLSLGLIDERVIKWLIHLIWMIDSLFHIICYISSIRNTTKQIENNNYLARKGKSGNR